MTFNREATLAGTTRYLTLDEAGVIYGCHPRTFRRMISRGDIKGYRLPGSRLLRVRVDEIESAMTAVPTGGGG